MTIRAFAALSLTLGTTPLLAENDIPSRAKIKINHTTAGISAEVSVSFAGPPYFSVIDWGTVFQDGNRFVIDAKASEIDFIAAPEVPCVETHSFALPQGLGGNPIPVESDGGIGDGAGPLPEDAETGGDEIPADEIDFPVDEDDPGNGEWIPVEPDGGIGDGAGPLPEDAETGGDNIPADEIDFPVDGDDPGNGEWIPVEGDGGIGDGAGPLPEDAETGGDNIPADEIDFPVDGDDPGNGERIPVEGDGGIGDGAGPLPKGELTYVLEFRMNGQVYGQIDFQLPSAQESPFDDWLEKFMPEDQEAFLQAADPAAQNLDGDAWNNFEEFLFGTNPLDPAGSPIFRAKWISDDLGDHVAIAFQRRKGAEDHAEFIVEASENLQEWVSDPDLFDQVETRNLGETLEEITVCVKQPTQASKLRFLRVTLRNK